MKKIRVGLVVGVLLLSGCTVQKSDSKQEIAVNEKIEDKNLESSLKEVNNQGLTLTVEAETSNNKKVKEFIYYKRENGLYELNLQDLVEKKIDPLFESGGDPGQVVGEVLIYENANQDIIKYDGENKEVLESDAWLIKVLTDRQSQKHYLYYRKNDAFFIKEMEKNAQSYEVNQEVKDLVIYGGRRYYTVTNEDMNGELNQRKYGMTIKYEDIVPMTYVYTSQLSGEDKQVLIDPVAYKETVCGKWEERRFGYLYMTLADVAAGHIYFGITIEDGDYSMSTNEELGGAYIADLQGENGEYKGKILKSHSPFSEEDYAGFYSNRRYFNIGLNISKKNPDVAIEGVIFEQEGDWVYYSDLDEQKVAKTNLVTGETKELFKAPISVYKQEIVKLGDWIYYTEDIGQTGMNLTSCAWNEVTGERREEPFDEEIINVYRVTNYYESLTGKRIYLGNGCIYQFDVETEEEIVLKNQVGYYLDYMKVTE